MVDARGISSDTLRGASFHNDSDSLLAAHRGDGLAANDSYRFGFRVAEVPEPGTIGLLGLRILAELGRRQK